MDRFLFVAGVIALPAVCTTLGAAGVLLMRRPAGPKVQRMLCGTLDGGWDHAGGQCVEPAPACDRPG